MRAWRYKSNYEKRTVMLRVLCLALVCIAVFLWSTTPEPPPPPAEKSDKPERKEWKQDKEDPPAPKVPAMNVEAEYWSEPLPNTVFDIQKSLSYLLFWNVDADYWYKNQLSEAELYSFLDPNLKIARDVIEKGVDGIASDNFDDISKVTSAFTQLHAITHFRKELQRFFTVNFKDVALDVKLFERSLFPWLTVSVTDLYNSFSGRGIAITSGNKHVHYALLLISSLRRVLNVKLPIEVYFVGEDDLSKENQQLLGSFENVRVIDLAKFVVRERLPGATGWSWKPFVVLLSSFQEVIFMDADALFFVDPATLFDIPNYKLTGVLLFRDRTISFFHWKIDKLHDLLKRPSATLKDSQMWKGKTEFEVESAVLVYDKKRLSSFYGLLHTCHYNYGHMKDFLYTFVLGDKETFWLSMELQNLPYKPLTPYGGAIGYQVPEYPNHVCGHLSHTDDAQNLLWFNSGVVSKINSSFYLEFTHFSTEFEHANTAWVDETTTRPYCFKPADPTNEIKKLTAREKDLVDKYVAMHRQIQQFSDRLFDVQPQLGH